MRGGLLKLCLMSSVLAQMLDEGVSKSNPASLNLLTSLCATLCVARDNTLSGRTESEPLLAPFPAKVIEILDPTELDYSLFALSCTAELVPAGLRVSGQWPSCGFKPSSISVF